MKKTSTIKSVLEGIGSKSKTIGFGLEFPKNVVKFPKNWKEFARIGQSSGTFANCSPRIAGSSQESEGVPKNRAKFPNNGTKGIGFDLYLIPSNLIPIINTKFKINTNK